MRTFTRISIVGCLLVCNSFVLQAQQAKVASTDSVTNDSISVRDNPPVNEDGAKLKKPSNEDNQTKSYLMAGVSYLSDNVYQGRKDTVVLPYLSPSLGYYFKSGFYINGIVNYLVSFTQNRIDNVDIEAGYSFSAGKYDGEITADKFFYNSQSTSVKSEIAGSLSYANGYDFGFVKPTVTGTLSFGNKSDIAAEFGLEHSFSLLDDKMDITPTVSANASTQNYYSSYYKKRKYKPKKKSTIPVNGITSISGIVENASAFKLLDYEMSIPIDYQSGKFEFNFTPVYAIPVNPAVTDITTTKANNTSTTRTITEKLQNRFYFSVGVTYSFGK